MWIFLLRLTFCILNCQLHSNILLHHCHVVPSSFSILYFVYCRTSLRTIWAMDSWSMPTKAECVTKGAVYFVVILQTLILPHICWMHCFFLKIKFITLLLSTTRSFGFCPLSSYNKYLFVHCLSCWASHCLSWNPPCRVVQRILLSSLRVPDRWQWVRFCFAAVCTKYTYNDYHLFPGLKKHVGGAHFGTKAELKRF